jgi:hypothetical protein
MVLVKELRIVLPFKLADYNRGAVYTAARSAFEASVGAQGSDAIEIAKFEEYFDEELQQKGTYTRRIYHIGNYLPGWISALLPKSAVTFYEDSYDCFPKVDTRVTNEWIGERLEFRIQTRIVEDGDLDDVHNLTPEQVKLRKIQKIDINEYESKDLDSTMRPSNVKLEKVVPSHLFKGWIEKVESLVWAYKLVTVKVQVWGLQGKLESWIMGFEQDLLTRVHLNIYTWADEWFGLSVKEVDQYVLKCKEDLEHIAAAKRGDDEPTEEDKEKEDTNKTAKLKEKDEKKKK